MFAQVHTPILTPDRKMAPHTLEAVGRMPTSAATYGLESTLTAAHKNSINEKQLGHLINTMLDAFIGKCARIRRAKPTTGAAS
jgi:hypothetical protein